ISAVGLHAARPLSVHRRIVRVGHDDLVAQIFEAAGDPLTLRGRLHEDLGRWPTAKHLDQARALRANPPGDQLTVPGEDRNLAFPLPEVHANMVHGEPPRAAVTARKLWGS